VLQHSLKSAFRRLGIDVRKMKNVPSATFLGLGKIDIECILDVGANVGQFARYARRMFPRSRIYCFEPLPAVADKLREWAAATSDMNISVEQIALGDSVGIAELKEHLDHSPSSSFLENTARADAMFPQTTRQAVRQVEVDTLDRWVAHRAITVGDRSLLKLDVQGFESQVLRGGKETLRQLGVCMVEVTPIPLYENQSTFVEIVNLLADGGLLYLGNLEQFHDERGLALYMDAVFVRPSLLKQTT
jgi:FkbM family methyltransferase